MTSFLGSLMDALRQALEPLATSFQDEVALEHMLERLGWNATINPASMMTIRNQFGLQSLFQSLQTLVEQLQSGSTDELQLAITLRDALMPIISQLRKLGETPPAGLPSPLDSASDFWKQLPKELPDYLLINYLEREQPLLFSMLSLLGLVEVRLENPLGAGRIPYMKYILHWENLGQVVGDPGGYLGKMYHWDDGTAFDHSGLLRSLERVALALRLPVRYVAPHNTLANVYYPGTNNLLLPQIHQLELPILSGAPTDGSGYIEVGLLILPIPPKIGTDSPPSGLLLTTLARGQASERIDLGAFLELILQGGFEADGTVGIELYPKEVHLGLTAPTMDAKVALVGHPIQPWLLLGSPDSHRIEVGGVKIAIGLRGSASDPELILELGTGEEPNPPKIAVVIQAEDADSFIQKIFGSEAQKLEFGGLLSWSSKTGFALHGDIGFTFTVPINRTIGTVEINSLTAGIQKAETDVDIIVALTGGAKIGPISASVEKIGVKLSLTPVKAGQLPGLFGDLDLAFGFKPPDGLGLVVAAGPITGGGFLSIDTANGRYAGVLQLNAGMIAITAVGLLDTKLPGGKPGFSFLIIITVKFPPIQLGFGFALTGLGGLAGIHRSIVVKALQDGVRSKSIDNILFPENPVRDAPKLISDLQSIFPPTEGQFVFGPMAIITWGTPTVVEAELGIILELPNPIRLVILGQVNVTLPDKKVPVAVIDLHIDIVGIIDFTNKNLSIDASLHDSRLLAYNLYGDMAMRLSWGDPPNFALSVGGLHPQFQPPPDFPTLRRLTVALGLGENPRISLQAYLAVTSNTVQFGALAELYAEAAGFNVYGWIGFDVLFIFSPFSLTADFSAGVALRKGSTIIASVHLAATLTGPTPWHAWGEANISILFLSVTVTFDATFGEEAQLVVEVADPWAALEAEIKKLGNWSATLPPAISQVVSLIAPGADEPGLALIDPLGGLTLRQKAVPFDRTLTKFGQGNLAQTKRFTVGGVTVGTQPATNGSPLLDYFAPGQFEEMSDAEKLSRSSFEQMQAGMTIASDAVAFGTAKGTNYTYKTVIIDAPDAEPRTVEPYDLKANHQTVALQRSAVAQSQLHTTGLDKFAPPPSEPALVTLDEEEHIIVNTTSMADQTEMILKYKLVPEWKPSVQHSVGDRILPSLTNGYIYRCVVAGTTGASEPGWPTVGSSASDGTVTWQEFDDQALKTKGARSQLLAEYLVDHPEEMSTLEVMPMHEVMEAV